MYRFEFVPQTSLVRNPADSFLPGFSLPKRHPHISELRPYPSPHLKQKSDSYAQCSKTACPRAHWDKSHMRPGDNHHRQGHEPSHTATPRAINACNYASRRAVSIIAGRGHSMWHASPVRHGHDQRCRKGAKGIALSCRQVRFGPKVFFDLRNNIVAFRDVVID